MAMELRWEVDPGGVHTLQLEYRGEYKIQGP